MPENEYRAERDEMVEQAADRFRDWLRTEGAAAICLALAEGHPEAEGWMLTAFTVAFNPLVATES